MISRMPAPLSPVDRSAAPVIRPLATDAEAQACAALMSSIDPWLRLGRSFDESLRIVRDPAREVYVAIDQNGADPGTRVAGFVVIVMQGAFVGYIQSVAVGERWRGRGVGSTLLTFAERRIFRDEPNVFICVSSFNPRARRLYERLGFEVVGELRDYVVRGHAELLLRKTIGPLSEPVRVR
jgi:ribosomal protein S18 acetylase RimI-like enzyme